MWSFDGGANFGAAPSQQTRAPRQRRQMIITHHRNDSSLFVSCRTCAAAGSPFAITTLLASKLVSEFLANLQICSLKFAVQSINKLWKKSLGAPYVLCVCVCARDDRVNGDVGRRQQQVVGGVNKFNTNSLARQRQRSLIR